VLGEPVAPTDWDLWNGSFVETPAGGDSAAASDSDAAKYFYSWRQILPRNGPPPPSFLSAQNWFLSVFLIPSPRSLLARLFSALSVCLLVQSAGA
jgi:hypothetical protein